MRMRLKKLKIGIVGHGFVGKATDWGFNRNVEKLIVDPIYNNSLSDLCKFDPDILFVCVPTPMGTDGCQDQTILTEVISDIKNKFPKKITVIKSTVLPDLLVKLNSENNNLVYNPEFLREKHANEDFKNAPFILLGGDRNKCNKVAQIFKDHSRCKTEEYRFTDISSASFIKYCINTFLALKVVYFNQLFHLFEALGENDNWNDIIEILKLDKRIGGSHMDVPGHDGRHGFGGACFPKDTSALVNYSKSLDINMQLLENAISLNNKLRSAYNFPTEREKEQNISFDKDD